jgi:hypothetical protein
MKYILITQRFQRQLKHLQRDISEQDIVKDIRQFIQQGIAKGETYLEARTILTVHLQMVKLRICVHRVDFRYLLGIINAHEYLPIIIDLKKGRHGENLSFKADKDSVRAIESALINVIDCNDTKGYGHFL